jgi:cation diffusion facilitator CzcD-associated flavoprotein CzcO
VKIAVIGAGVAGLVTAKVLTQMGHEVTVFDKTPDVGGVWSETRRYPGVTTQSPRSTYALSDFPMPKDYPEWPTGAQVQSYLAAYAAHFGLERMLRLNTEVVSAVRGPDGRGPDGRGPDGRGWTLALRSTVDGREETASADHLVVANGVFCEPNIPALTGVDDFIAAGGRLCAASDFHDAEDARGKHVVVVGYGKTACDVAVAISEVSASTTVVARQLLWKMPRRIANRVNFKYLLLTRLGEALFRYARLRGFEKFLHGPGNRIRHGMLSSVGDVATKQLKLNELELLPRGVFADIVRNAIGLISEGFFEGVAAGQITVHRDAVVRRLLEKDGERYAELSDDTLARADLVVCATGYRQEVPFFDATTRDALTDDRGNFALYRQVHPIDVADLSFAGYNSSFFSPLSAEVAALWIAAKLAGTFELPDQESLRSQVEAQLAFMDDATDGHHCRGTKVIPFSMHNIDELLDDVGVNIGPLARAAQWLGPVNPRSYRTLAAKVQRRGAEADPPAGQQATSTATLKV